MHYRFHWAKKYTAIAKRVLVAMASPSKNASEAETPKAFLLMRALT